MRDSSTVPVVGSQSKVYISVSETGNISRVWAFRFVSFIYVCSQVLKRTVAFLEDEDMGQRH